MHIAYTLTAQDFVHFQEYYLKKKAPLVGCLQPAILLILICNIITGVALYFYQGVTTYTYVCLVCVILLGIVLIGKGQAKKKMTKAALKMEKEKPGAFGDMTIDLDEKGMQVHSSTQEKFLSWNEVDHQESNKDYFFIYSKKGMVYIIPKRDIQVSDSEMNELLNQYIANKQSK
jgi:hypothetical protein